MRRQHPELSTRHPERGSGTVLAAGLGMVLILGLAMLMLLAQASVMAGRAAAAADLAALAAADSWRGLTAGEPCAVAGEVAGRHDAEVLECIKSPDHSVEVRIQLHHAAVFGPATARSRAGPPPGRGPGPAD
ncbi:Rv3654c family TadE-like protein [Pseudarthrobacter sp. J64]|uniref:Rv3654c family TadE-like protein n=1 Tax=Pseudarthrobacter sp. J64 TaxID=3116485 RepID=UPI002E822090|nr:Rv3654c family TadE-like protein [Pseudarthrobacter sp. J64]MEE2567792.1 Rv3654c family TadE-like protein [Pseudarthrobacter sp. J64]